MLLDNRNQVLRYCLGWFSIKSSLCHLTEQDRTRGLPRTSSPSSRKPSPLSRMISWTLEPKALTITCGKHRGSKWGEIPIDYLQLMARQTDMDADASWCASQ